jgi:hypothetical protein
MSESEARLAVVASLRTVQVRRKSIVRKREVLHPLRRLVIEQQPNDVGAGVMPRRVSRVLRYADRGEIYGGITLLTSAGSVSHQPRRTLGRSVVW